MGNAAQGALVGKPVVALGLRKARRQPGHQHQQHGGGQQGFFQAAPGGFHNEYF